MSDHPNGRRAIYILSVAYFFSYLGVGAIQPFLGPYLEKVTGRPETDCVWVLGSVYIAGIFMRLVAALMVNTFGSRLTIVLGLVFCTGFSWLVVALPGHLGILIVGAVFWGWGAGCLWVAGSSMVLDLSPSDRYGANTSVLYVGVHLGQGLGVCLLGWIGSKYGEPKLFLAAAGISLVANLISFALPPRGRSVTPAKLREGMSILATWQGIILSFLMLSSLFGFGILLGNLSGMVAKSTQLKGVGSVGPITIGFYIARLVCSWFAGSLSDRFGRAPLLVVGYGIAAVGLIMAGFYEHPAVLFGAAMSLGVQMGVGSVAVGALVGDWAPPERRHVLLGTLYIWHGLGAAISLILGAKLKDLFGDYRPTFLIFGCVMAFCALLSVVLGFLSKPGERLGSKADR